MTIPFLFLALFALMFIGVPVAISLGLAGSVTIILFSPDSTFNRLCQRQCRSHPWWLGYWCGDGLYVVRSIIRLQSGYGCRSRLDCDCWYGTLGLSAAVCRGYCH